MMKMILKNAFFLLHRSIDGKEKKFKNFHSIFHELLNFASSTLHTCSYS